METSPIEKIPDEEAQRLLNLDKGHLKGGEIIDLSRLRKVKTKSSVEEFDRITIVGSFAHEHFGEPTTVTQIRATSMLRTKHQPCIRRRIITTVPTPLLQDCWIPAKDIGVVFIQNRYAARELGSDIPKAKMSVYDRRVVFLFGTEKDSKVEFRIHPTGIPFLGEVSNADQLSLRSNFDDVPVNVHIYPK